MRFRLGFVIGFGAGYYLGARAGRERYVQLNRALEKLRRSEIVETAAEKAKAAVDQGVDKARDLVESKAGDGRAETVPPAPPPPASYGSSS